MMMSKGLAPETKPARIFSKRSPKGKVCNSTVPPVFSAHFCHIIWTGLATWGPVWVATTSLTPLALTWPMPFGKRLLISAVLVRASGGTAAAAAVVGVAAGAAVGEAATVGVAATVAAAVGLAAGAVVGAAVGVAGALVGVGAAGAAVGLAAGV